MADSPEKIDTMKYRVICSCGIMDDDVCHDTKEDADREFNRLLAELTASKDIDMDKHILSIQEVSDIPEEHDDQDIFPPSA